MTSIALKVCGTSAKATTTGLLTEGSAGIPVSIEYDDEWDGLTKTIVFKAGETVRDAYDIGSETEVAPEVMISGCWLFIGIYGESYDGTLIIPTIWARVGKINPAAVPPGDPGCRPTPSVVQKMEQLVESAEAAAAEAQAAVDAALENIHAIIITAITVPADGWEPSGNADYPLCIDVPCEKSGASMFANVAFDTVSQLVAASAGLSATVETLDGYLRFWSQTAPAAPLTATVALLSAVGGAGGNGGSGDVLTGENIAGDQEVSDTVTEVFGSTSSGGEIAGDDEVEDTVEDVFGESGIASDEDIEETLNGIFGT